MKMRMKVKLVLVILPKILPKILIFAEQKTVFRMMRMTRIQHLVVTVVLQMGIVIIQMRIPIGVRAIMGLMQMIPIIRHRRQMILNYKTK